MAIELMEEIKAAEARADDVRAQAQRESREMIKSVEEACMEHERAAQKDARKIYQDALNAKRAAVEKEIASHSGEKKRALDDMMAKARKNVSSAAQLVFERIVNDGNR